jgi:uncharacterized protein YoxC
MKWLNWFLAALAVSGVYAFIEIGMLAANLRQTSKTLRGDGHTFISNLDVQINGSEGDEKHKGKVEGLLPQTRAFIRDSRTDAVAFYKQEAAYSKSLNAKTEIVFGNVQSVLNMANGKMVSLDVAGISQDTRLLLQALTTDANHAAQLIDSLRKGIEDLDKTIADPEIHKALVDLAATAAGTQEFMVKLNAIMEDIRGKIHESTHPSKKQRALSALLGSLKAVYYLYQIAQ